MQHKVANLSDFASDSMKPVEIDGTAIVLIKSCHGIFALEDRCSHADFKLSDGTCDDEAIECAAHGARFALSTGQPLCAPAFVGVKTFPVRIIGEDVFIEI